MEAAQSPPTRRLSIAQLALAVPWVALVIGAWGPIADNSFLWHVRAGTVQAQAGRVLTEDPFSFTMGGERWLTQSWLAELLYNWAEGLSGLGFVPWMILSVGTLTFVAVGLIAYRLSQSVTSTVFVLTLSVLVMIGFLVPRPVIFSFLLMGLVVLAWQDPKARWLLPFLFWIWAAFHASFVVGLVFIALSLIMSKEWRALPVVVVSGLATLATAHGLGVIGFLLEFNESREALNYLREWRRPQILDAVFLPLAGGLVFIVLGSFRQTIAPRHLWLIVPFAALSLTSVRAIPAAWLALVPLVALSLSGLTLGTKGRLRFRLAGVYVAVVLLIPFLLIEDSRLQEDRFPLHAANHLSTGQVFHDDVAGGYLIWKDGPDRLVYIDDRAELYGARLGEFVRVRSGKIPWQPIFERDGIDQVLLAVDEHLVTELTAEGWRTQYSDDNFVVLSLP